MKKADERIRTSDLSFTKALLYQLSYIGISLINVAVLSYEAKSESILAK